MLGEQRYRVSKAFSLLIIEFFSAFGFSLEENGSTLVLRDPNGFRWETVPADVRQTLQARLEDLRSHKSSLLEPTISNIAAVSSAIASLGKDAKTASSWLIALETILLIVSNITKNPKVVKYYRVNTANSTFHQKIGRVENAAGTLLI
jgi:hypothetical protein